MAETTSVSIRITVDDINLPDDLSGGEWLIEDGFFDGNGIHINLEPDDG